MSICQIVDLPAFDDVLFSFEWKDHYGPDFTRQHDDHAGNQSGNTAMVKELSQAYGINPRAVLKWKKHTCIEDLKTGPKQLYSTIPQPHLCIAAYSDTALAGRSRMQPSNASTMTHHQPGIHLTNFINAYNYARRLKTLSDLTPYEYICKMWTNQPEKFILNPNHHKQPCRVGGTRSIGLNNSYSIESNYPPPNRSQTVRRYILWVAFL